MGYSPNNRNKRKYNKLLFIHTATATGSAILTQDVCLGRFNLVKDKRGSTVMLVNTHKAKRAIP